MANPELINDIDRLFGRQGDLPHDPGDRDSVTVQQHALQCAQLAEWADTDEALVAAALLQATGRMLAESTGGGIAEDARDVRAAAWLSEGFDARLTDSIRLLPEARRYLRATDTAFAASRAGKAVAAPMTTAEQLEFDALQHGARALQLARLIEQARAPIPRTPPLDYYLALLEDIQRQYDDGDKLEVGPQTVT
jgi:predicted HD phosphohydrolase